MSTVQNPFSHNKYVFRRKVFRIFGGEFNIYDGSGNLVLYSEQKSFKIREDLRVYTEKEMMNEVLQVKTKQMLDFGATYRVVDPRSGEAVGALRRKGLKSIFKDEWLLLDPQDQEIGAVQEDNMAMALLMPVKP